MYSVDVRFVGKNGFRERLGDYEDRLTALAVVDQFIRFNTMNRPGWEFKTQTLNSDCIQVLTQETTMTNYRPSRGGLYCILYVNFQEGDRTEESRVVDVKTPRESLFAVEMEVM